MRSERWEPLSGDEDEKVFLLWCETTNLIYTNTLFRWIHFLTHMGIHG